MPLVALTTYYAKLITLDKQGNQTTGSQYTIVADAVHNADVHPDLQQTFHIHGTNGQQLGAASGSVAPLFYVTDYLSGSGSYSSATGLYTVGQTGKLLFTAAVEVVGPVSHWTGASGYLSLIQNGNAVYDGPIAAPMNAGAVGLALTAVMTGSLACTIGDTVGVKFNFSGCTSTDTMTGRITQGFNTYFDAHITPG